MNKKELRQLHLSSRMSMGKDELKKKSITVNQKILNLINNLSNNSKIGLFYPYKNEVNVLLLAKTLEEKRKICLLPKVIAKNQPLKYFPYSHRAPFLEKGFGGIMEPTGQLSEDPDIIIASCAAFNDEGFRVGYGGGFFDRTIMELKKNKNLITILAAFELQKTKYQFQESFDEKVDYICTEDRTYTL